MPRSKTTTPPRGYVWIDEAAERIGVGKTTLYKWKYRGVGPTPVPIARRLAYRIADLDAHLDALYSAAVAPLANEETRPPEPRIGRRPMSPAA